jgi:hypothetical protein
VTPSSDEPSDGRPDPEKLDAEFDAIVARLTAPDTGAVPWPDAEETSDAGDAPPPPTPALPQRTPDRDWAEWDDLRIPSAEPEADSTDDQDEDDDEGGHFVPPEPAPVPRGDSRLRWAWAGALGAPLLAILLPLLGWGLDGLTGIGLVLAFLVGFGYLISRLREGPRVDGGPDDGAVV